MVNGEVSAENILRGVYWLLPETGDDVFLFKVTTTSRVLDSIRTVRKKSIINCIILNVSEAFDFHIKFYAKSDFVGPRTLVRLIDSQFRRAKKAEIELVFS